MKKNIESFPNQLLYELSSLNKLKITKDLFSSVLIVGQGGSSIGALLLKDLLIDLGTIHIINIVILVHGMIKNI